MAAAQYRRRGPEQSLLHRIVRENLESFYAEAEACAPGGRGLPRYVRGAFERYLDCGVLAKGFVRVRCHDCGYDAVVGFSCKERGLCPSCGGRRMREWLAFSDPPGPVPKLGQREEWSLPPIPEKALCARAESFSLHAAVRIAASDREGLEKICRYVLRPPLAEDRLSMLPDGRVAYGFRRPRPDGSTHVVMQPLQFLEKLAALVPPPRSHLIRYHGVLAPHSAIRSRVIPREEPPAESGACGHGTPERRESAPSPSAEGEAKSPMAEKTPSAPELRRDSENTEPVLPAPRSTATPFGTDDTGNRPRRGPPGDATPDAGVRPRYYDWATLMKRGLGLDIPRAHCTHRTNSLKFGEARSDNWYRSAARLGRDRFQAQAASGSPRRGRNIGMLQHTATPAPPHPGKSKLRVGSNSLHRGERAC